jgi:hypothetical protein
VFGETPEEDFLAPSIPNMNDVFVVIDDTERQL